MLGYNLTYSKARSSFSLLFFLSFCIISIYIIYVYSNTTECITFGNTFSNTKDRENLMNSDLVTMVNVMETNRVSELYTRWLKYLDASPRTVETYRKALNQFFKWTKDDIVLKPSREDILLWRNLLLKDHKPTTVNTYLMALKQFFKWTSQEGLYPDIADRVKAPKLSREHKKDYLTTRQSKRLLRKIDRTTLQGLRDYSMLSLMITTGLRTIEVVRADISDIRTIGDFQVLSIQGKGRTDKSDYVKITPQVEDAIRAYLNARGAKKDEPLFSAISNKNLNGRLTTRSISRIVKTRLIECGYDSDRLTAHSLRHTTATLNLMGGATLEETRQLLRHTDINTTLIYVHALERVNNQSEQRISNLIF